MRREPDKVVYGVHYLVLSFDLDDCEYMGNEFSDHNDGFDSSLGLLARDFYDANKEYQTANELKEIE
jgi:hypothetical protein